MSHIRLYLDEDAMQGGLVLALRSRHVDVLTAFDCGMTNRSDEDHLDYAGSRGRVLYSFNIRDYTTIHANWIVNGKTHSGILLAPQQRYSIGEQLKILLYFFNRKSAEEMHSQIEYLPNWSH